MKRFLLCCALLLSLLGSPTAGLAALSPSAPAALRLEVPLRAGLMQGAFTGVNENDAIAAYRNFAVAMGRRRGYEVQVEVSVFSSLADFERAIREGRLHVVIASSWQYLTMNVGDLIALEFVPVTQGAAQRRLLLLAGRSAGIHSIADLRGKSVLLLKNITNNLSDHWLDSLCIDADLGPASRSLAAPRNVVKPSAALLPVFFGRESACVVDEQAFAVACELNPQLGRELVVVATSPPLLDGILGLARSGWPSDKSREDLRQALRDEQFDPAGRQILTLLKTERLAPFDPEMLVSVAALFARRPSPSAPVPDLPTGPARIVLP